LWRDTSGFGATIGPANLQARRVGEGGFIAYRRISTQPDQVRSQSLEPISKNGFWFKIKAAANINPEEY
jgi:hypothetical protein